MRTPPADLELATILDAVERHWGIGVVQAEHRPVGFGSYHWLAYDGTMPWWITVDDLDAHRASEDEPLDEAFAGLRGAMAAVRALGDAGYDFVVAPCPSNAGEPLVRVTDRYAVVVHPFVEGTVHEWGDVLAEHERTAIVDALAALHSVVQPTDPPRPDEGRAFDHRHELESAVGIAAPGPYGESTNRLMRKHHTDLARVLAHLDHLMAGAGRSDRFVLSHGEPHPGNLMAVDGRWVLIDWDTVRLAPPERDLWMLVDERVYPATPAPSVGRGGPSATGELDVVARYEAATGTTVDQELLEAYRLRWDLADAAGYVHHFRSPHTGTADDDHAWTNLQEAVARLT